MGQKRPHSDLGLPPGRELGPVARDRGIEFDLPTLDENQDAKCRNRLANGEDVHEGVTLPRSGPSAVHPSAPDVDDELSVEDDRHRGAELAAFEEIAHQRIPHGHEAPVTVAVDLWNARHAAIVTAASPRFRRLYKASTVQDRWLARSTAARQSVVLPMPGTPRIERAIAPIRTASRNWSTSASSSTRP